MTEKPTGKTRGRKRKNILEKIVPREDFPKFRLWSQLIDRTPIPQYLQTDKFWGLLEKYALNIYEEYGGNGRHRRLEKLFSLPYQSLQVSQPTSLQSSNARFFILPPPISQIENENIMSEHMKWWEQVEQWLALRELNWIESTNTNNHQKINKHEEEQEDEQEDEEREEQREEQKKIVMLLKLNEWEERDLFQLERLLFRSKDSLTVDGELGQHYARDCFWFATTEPGIQYRNELRQWFHFIRLPSFRPPRWKDCYEALQEEIQNLLEKDPWIRYMSQIHHTEFGELKLYYPQKFYVEIYFVETQRLRIRLQTTRKREFSWCQFWNEMQLLMYMLMYRIQEPNIQRFQWYLFAPNQFQFIPSLNP